jgi:hypothetical protein
MSLLKTLWAWGVWIIHNQMGQIPSSLTDNFDALLTTTLRAVEPKLRDNITRSNRVLAWLDSKGRMRKQDGGERVQVPLMFQQNTTADIYSSYGLLNTTPQDGITSAFFSWSQLSTSIAISRKEERQNSGKARILGLLEAKTMQAEVSLRELLNNCIVAGRITSSSSIGQFFARVGTMDSGATGPLPLPVLIDSSASRSVSVGNINGNTYSWWQNQALSSSATTWAGYFREMSNVYNLCSKGVGGYPDLIVGSQKAWETYWNGLRNQERYVVDDKRTIDILGGTGIFPTDMLKFRGAVYFWDEVVPDTQTTANGVDGIGTFTVDTNFFINSDAMEFVTDSQTDFITTPFVRPQDQDAKVAQILWMGAMGVNNRRKLGVQFNISQSITS